MLCAIWQKKISIPETEIILFLITFSDDEDEEGEGEENANDFAISDIQDQHDQLNQNNEERRRRRSSPPLQVKEAIPFKNLKSNIL